MRQETVDRAVFAAVERLDAYVDLADTDPDEAMARAGSALCALLLALGQYDVVDLYDHVVTRAMLARGRRGDAP